jgi:hypothetical protein
MTMRNGCSIDSIDTARLTCRNGWEVTSGDQAIRLDDVPAA